MPNELKLTRRDISWIVTIIIVVGGFVIRTEILNSKVKELEKTNELYNPAIIMTNQKNIAEDVDEIKGDVKELIRVFNEYMLNQ